MSENKTEKPKNDLEKLVGQLKVKVALDINNPSAILNALNIYPYTSNVYSDPREDPVNAMKSVLKSGEIDQTTRYHCTGLANIYSGFIEERANINDIKSISERLGHKIPDISNLVSGNMNFGKLKKEYVVLKRKLEDNKDYKPNKKEVKTFEAYTTIDENMKFYEQKTRTKDQGILLIEEAKARNDKYKPVKKAA